MDKDLITKVEMKGLTLGVELSLAIVSRDICPECRFETGYCKLRMSMSLAHPELVFVCPGMRAWVARSNFKSSKRK